MGNMGELWGIMGNYGELWWDNGLVLILDGLLFVSRWLAFDSCRVAINYLV